MLYKSTKPILGILIPLLGILLIACESKKEKTTEVGASNTSASKLPVDIIIAQERELKHDEVVVGTMLPFQQVAIVSEIPQKVARVAFKDGSYVEQGATLYLLNDAEISSRLKQVGAELELAKLTKERLHNLLKNETVKQQEYDEALMRFRSLKAQDELLRVELNKTVIKAPFSGKIGITKVHTGAYVSPGTELVTLEDQSNIKINFSIPERYLSLVKIGSSVTFTTDFSDEIHSATITATEPGLDKQGRSLQVQAVTKNVSRKFRAGQTAKVYFRITGDGAKGIDIPTEALMPDVSGYHVFVIKEGVTKPVPVTISNRTETDAIITSGVTTGDSIVISNTLRIGDGTPVKAIIGK